MLITTVLLSETIVNKSSEEEPAFRFFCKNFANI